MKSVLVTGANGYLGSHIVRKLLAKGYMVHGAVRDITKRVDHLRALDGAKERLVLFGIGDLTTASFDECMKGCSYIIHTATPLNPKFHDDFDGERDIYCPAMVSTKKLLECIEKSKKDVPVECLVLTSSMSAVAPYPEPDIKDETHWSDASRQKSRKNWYGATKTDQERLCQTWSEERKRSDHNDFRFAAICPTMIIGPILDNQKVSSGTMGTLLKWFQGGKIVAPNDSMSFIHVEDCAAHHVAAMERGEGRYMSLIESWHWNDIATLLMKLNPTIKIQLFKGGQGSKNNALISPTRFNLDRMNSLGCGPVKSMQDTIEESFEYLKKVGAL